MSGHHATRRRDPQHFLDAPQGIRDEVDDERRSNDVEGATAKGKSHGVRLLESGACARRAIRRSFDSTCGLAGFMPNYVLECRSPHALLAMAQAGHGVAIIPSALRVHRYALRLLQVVYRGKPLSEPLTILYDKRRPLPAFAKAFCDMAAAHAKKVFPAHIADRGIVGSARNGR